MNTILVLQMGSSASWLFEPALGFPINSKQFTSIRAFSLHFLNPKSSNHPSFIIPFDFKFCNFLAKGCPS